MSKEISSRSATHKNTARQPKTEKPAPSTPAADSLSLQRALAEPLAASPGAVLTLQAQYGNRAVQRVLSAPSPEAAADDQVESVQAKLAVGPADDHYEREADRVASDVMRSVEQALPLAVQPEPTIQPLTEVPQLGLEGGEAGSAIEQALASNKGSGAPLPDHSRTFMEQRIGVDFGGVRVHTGAQADSLNRKLGAQAFTHGADVYFGEGKYNPGSSQGQQLLAHELTHVVQQGGASQTAALNRKAGAISAGAVALGSQLQLARSKAGRAAGTFFGPILAGLLMPFLLAKKAGAAAGKKGLGTDPATGQQRTWANASAGQRAKGFGLGALGAIGGLLGGAVVGGLFSALNLALLGIPGAVAANMAATETFGSKDDRQAAVPAAGANPNYVVQQLNIRPADVGEQGRWILRGRRYTPTNPAGPGVNKVIVLFSGTGGSNESQLTPLARYYTGQGSVVYGANYRGYGESKHDENVADDETMLSEAGLSDDAARIYQFAVNDSGAAPGNVILHGYSLGGSVATRLAKRLAKQGTRLGGLVLHSSIDTAYTQADKGSSGMMGEALGSVMGPLAGFSNKMAAGSFDTADELSQLGVYDRDLPVHLMSGSSADGDQLALGETGLTGVANANFNNANVSSFEGGGGHLQTGQHVPGHAVNDAAGAHQASMGALLGRGVRAQGGQASLWQRFKTLF